MDFSNILGDATTVAAIASGIVFAIYFLKKLYYKLPFSWVKRTPGEVWLVLSIAASIGVVIALNYSVLTENGMPLFGKLGVIISGLTVGAGSKLVHSVATSAGAKLNEIKVGSQASVSPFNNVPCDVPVETTTEFSTPVVPLNAPAPVTEIKLVKEVHPNIDYVIIDGTVYSIKKEGGK